MIAWRNVTLGRVAGRLCDVVAWAEPWDYEDDEPDPEPVSG